MRRDETTAAEIRACASNRRLDEAHTEKWLEMLTPSRMALLDYAERLNLRTGQLVVAIDLLDEIEIREGISPAVILARDELRRVCSQQNSTPWRAAAFIEELRKIRFPRLREAVERLSTEIAALKLPSGVRIILPKDLGSDELTIQISARTAPEMERVIDVLASKKPELVRIVNLIGGADDDAESL